MNPLRSKCIFYDARTVGTRMTGVGRYTLNLLRALAVQPGSPPIRALMRTESLSLARRDPALGTVKIVPTRVSHESHPWGDAWLRWVLPRQLGPDDIYHGPAFIIPSGRWDFGRVVTIHDMLVFTHPQFYPRRFVLWLRWRMRRACQCADRIIVPTQAVADELSTFGLATDEKVRVVAEAADETDLLWEGEVRSSLGQLGHSLQEGEGPMLMTVATRGPRKDIATARAAHVLLSGMLGNPLHDQGLDAAPDDGPTPLSAARSEPRVEWIWVGGKGPLADNTPPELLHQAASLGFHTVGSVPGAAIRESLGSAVALVSTSHAEGFGLPLVEAMLAGCPIVVTDIAVHREVAGDAALYFPVGDAPALARTLARIITDPQLRQDLAARARQRAHLFSWTTAAEQTLEIYRQIRSNG
jgi:glycosyltransferase involved in cell wall biosynthesis